MYFAEQVLLENQSPWVLHVGISMHVSPRTFMERAKWKRFVLQHRKNFNPKGSFGVCSLHFTSDCFTHAVHVKDTERRLKGGSVPTIWKEASVSLSERSRRRVSEFAEFLFRAYLSLCCDILTNQGKHTHTYLQLIFFTTQNSKERICFKCIICKLICVLKQQI